MKGIPVQVKVIKPNQEIRLVQSDQIMVLIKSDQRLGCKLNQGLGLIKASQNIQSLHIGRCSIMADGMTLNCETLSINSIVSEDSL